MRIKRLELQGFKSFKDKTVINFDEGITGIVGPNGCGKSNVVDAFFWVMGEQNARHLRGQAMDDLIFSGSDKSPAGSFAEVTLILEMPAELTGPNAPAGASARDVTLATLPIPTREVAITRKLYRSGESEYFINKTPCRLRDIQELFMDTGVGARGYSIIQQGQIAKIVQAKPEDRRTMIEEVAGIVKYKARRRESMRKLESTQQNLLRVADVINELETQKRQMERQADKARKYKEWKTKLQDIELRFNALKWEDHSDKLGLLDREINELNALDAAITAERESEETQIAAKRMEATSASKVTEEFQDKWMRTSQDLSGAETDLKYSQKNLEDLRASSAQLEQDAEAERLQVEEIRAEHETLSAQALSIDADYLTAEEDRKNKELLAQTQKQDLENLERNAEQTKNKFYSVSSALTEALNQASFSQLRMEELQENFERISAQKMEREEVLASSLSDKDGAAQRLQDARASVDQTRATISQLSNEINEAQKSLHEQRKAIAQLSSEQARAKATLSSLEEQKDRHESSSNGVKNVFQKILPKNESWKQSVRGTLADVLNVEPGMETAVETALGRNLDLILTNDASLHTQIANSLKGEASGRAAFADLEKVRSLLNAQNTEFSTSDSALTADVMGPLTNFVKAQADSNGATELLSHLASNIIVVRNAETAQQLAQQNPSFSFITQDGEICRGGWFLEGGDRSSVSGAYVGRNREIAELGDKLQSLTQNLETAQADLQSLETKVQDLEQQKRAQEEEFRNHQSALSTASSEEATLSARLQEAEKALARMAEEFERLEAEKNRLASQQIQAQEKATQFEIEKATLEEQSASLTTAVLEARVKLEEIQQVMMDARIKFASIAEQKTTIQNRLNSSAQALQQRASRVEHMMEQALRKQGEATETIARIETLEYSIAELRILMVEAEKAYREARERMDVLNNDVEVHRSRAQELSQKEREAKDSLMVKRLDQERTNGERENLSQNTFERYGLTLGEYAMSPETMEQVRIPRDAGENTINEIQNEVMLLKEKIRKLGEVNTSAVEEYDQIIERYNFLTTQKADLEKSMADLQSTVDKINKVSKDRFERAFHEVNKHFQRVFPVIFGGGHASLMLTNPEDMLETGVDIMAQPPGKKPQNINLLSGGEKTLTAISLLFAIFLVKPSPFCLLDEVDAPLDDANIGRFNALLREMAKRSQFIIITHNKRTMELNDKLYGVTMEDAGVSKMVSIQMTAANATPTATA